MNDIWNYRPGAQALASYKKGGVPPTDPPEGGGGGIIGGVGGAGNPKPVDPPGSGGQLMTPPSPGRSGALDRLARWNREQAFYAANPSRRPGPMGLRANGETNYDRSIGWAQELDNQQIARRGLKPNGVNGGTPASLGAYPARRPPGVFNAAIPGKP